MPRAWAWATTSPVPPFALRALAVPDHEQGLGPFEDLVVGRGEGLLAVQAGREFDHLVDGIQHAQELVSRSGDHARG